MRLIRCEIVVRVRIRLHHSSFKILRNSFCISGLRSSVAKRNKTASVDLELRTNTHASTPLSNDQNPHSSIAIRGRNLAPIYRIRRFHHHSKFLDKGVMRSSNLADNATVAKEKDCEAVEVETDRETAGVALYDLNSENTSSLSEAESNGMDSREKARSLNGGEDVDDMLGWNDTMGAESGIELDVEIEAIREVKHHRPLLFFVNLLSCLNR